jgi:hypothetical protein
LPSALIPAQTLTFAATLCCFPELAYPDDKPPQSESDCQGKLFLKGGKGPAARSPENLGQLQGQAGSCSS